MNKVRCMFYLRIDDGNGAFHYNQIEVDSWNRDGALHTEHPPLKDDILWLVDRVSRKRHTVRVLERSWAHNQYGSANWPVTETEPMMPDILDILVVPAEGMFRNESSR